MPSILGCRYFPAIRDISVTARVAFKRENPSNSARRPYMKKKRYVLVYIFS